MKYNSSFWTMTLARRKQWLWRPPEMGISRTVLGCTIWDFFSIRFELQVIRKGCITITTNTKPLAIRDFIAGTCWWSQTNSRAELRLGKNTCWTPSISPQYRKMCTVVSFSRFQNNCGGYSAFPPTVINSSFGFYVYDFFVKFVNGLQLQGTSQIKFVALFTGNRTVRHRKLIQIIITSINSLIAYHNLTILSPVFDTTWMCNSCQQNRPCAGCCLSNRTSAIFAAFFVIASHQKFLQSSFFSVGRLR